MYFCTALDRTFGPYIALVSPDGTTQGDIRPILYDGALIQLSDNINSYSLGYKTSLNLFGKEIVSADIIDMHTGLSFSLQVSNIFFARVFRGDLKILVKIGNELKWYENFGSTEYQIEPDGDKKEITPLGYFDMFVRYDEEYYYPIILNEENEKGGTIKRFYDYYGFQSYTCKNGINHFILLIEGEESTEEKPIWYWTDNFHKSSDILNFDEAESVETWEIDAQGRISFVLTSGAQGFLDEDGKIQRGTIPKFKNLFSYTRYFEDTNSSTIIGKNKNGLFLIDRDISELSREEQGNIVYFSDFIACSKREDSPIFLLKTKTEEVIIVDKDGNEILTTDLYGNEKILSFQHESESIYSLQVEGEGVRKYIVP